MAWELTDPDFLQYCFIGSVNGAGTVGDPYEIWELNLLGYAAGEVNTLTLETGSEGGANDDVMTYDGIAINTFSLTATQGETIKCTAEWIGRTGTSSTTVETYVPPTNRPFTFVDGSVTVGSDTIGRITSFALTVANNIITYRSLGSRLIDQPIAGIRRYDFTMTIKHHFDNTASVLSSLEARGIVFNGTTTGTTPSDTGENPAVALSLDLVEGAAGGDRIINFDFENCYFESFSEPIALEEGIIEITIVGHALAGLTDTGNKVPCRFWTI